MKKFLSIMLSILMVVTMLPMAVMPVGATGAQAQVNDNFKVEITRLFYTDSSGTIYDYTDAFNSWALYDLALTNVSDGECQLQYTAALLGSDGVTGWDNDSVTLEGVSCDSAYTMSFEKFKTGSTGKWEYTIQISKTVGHAYSDWSYIDDEKHSRTCAINTAHTINGEHSYNNGFCSLCNSYEKPAIEPGEYDDETWDDTFLISNAGQLYWLAEYVNNVNNEAHAALTADITVPETAPNWVPIGGYYQWTPYTGYFDGRMHTISGLKCETEGYYAGLFGYTDYGNEIKNLGVINSSFKGIDNVGGLIGSSYSYVKNCYVADTTVEGTEYDVGTLIGYSGNEVSNCYTDGGTLIGGDSGTTANSYYLSETETEDGGKTEAQFASGEVAYLLQNGVSGEEVYDDEGNYVETVVPHIWGQKIDTDAYPVLGGDKVYQVSDCKNAEAYNNVDKDLGHNYVNGICTVCGEVCSHTGGTATCTEKAVCEICGEKYGETLAHTDEDSNEFCDVCGKLIDAKVLTSVGGYLYIDGVKIEPNGTSQDLPSGKYVLTGDISTYWTIREAVGESITLDLNGYVWNMGSSHLLLNGAFSLYDTSENETGKIVSSWNGTTIDLNNEACEFNLYGGTVENTSEDTDAKALASRYGTTNLYGGKLKGKAYAITCIENNGVKVNLEGASLECGEDFAHIKMLIDDTSSPAILDVTGYTGEALDVEVNTNTAGKFEIIEGITNAEEAEKYQIRFSSSYGELFLAKTEYDEETGAKYAYIERNAFTQQATADNNYTVTFNNPAATFQWYEIESEDLGTYSVETEGPLFTYEVKAGSILTVSTDSELEYIRILGIGGDEVWLSDTDKSVNVKFDSDTTINVYSSMQSPRTAIELKFSVVNETLLDGETGETLQNPECGKTYWCKATEGSIVYTSDTVSVTHNGEATCTDNGDGTHSAVYPCCGAAVAKVPHTLDVTTGKCSACGADMTAIATVTDGTNTYYAADAATLNQAVTAILETGSRTFTVELPADTEAEMITAIRRAICDTDGVADGSINLTLKGVTSIPGTTNWDGVAFGPGDIYDEAGKIVDQELVTQLASINLPDVTEIGAQAFYFCENLVTVSAPKAQTIGAQALGYTALTSVEFPELTTIPTDMFSGTWTLSSAKFPKVTTIEQGGLLIGAKFNPENNPTPFPLELTAEGDITFIGSNHFNIASQNYSGKVDLVLNCDKADKVTKNEDGTATWQVRDDLSYTFKSITFTCTDGTTNHSYTYTDNGDGTHDMVCTECGYVAASEAHSGGTATCTEQAKCKHCGASYGEVDADGHDWSNKDGICANCCGETCPHSSYTDGVCDKCDYECPHEWDEGVLTRPVYDAVLGSKDGYYTYTCTVCGEEKTETVKSADYSAYEAVSEEINVLLQSEELTPEAKQAIYSAANECGHLSNDLTESEQNIVDDLVAELEKIIADADEKIASGEYVKIDGMKEYNKIADALDAELMENYSQEEIAALAEKAGDEINARFGEIIEKAEALTGTVAENKDALAEIESEMRALYGEIKNCLDGVHNGLVYEVTEEAKCEVNAIESATCTLCGETDEREIEGTALEHEPNEQMCKGYWCSRCRSFYGEGNPDIHLDGYSSTGKIKDGQCDGCNKQLAFIKSGETYEINSYAHVVEFAPVVDGRYILTVDGPEGTEIDVREVVDGVNKGINCEVISDLVYVVDCTVGKIYRFEASNYYGYNISSMTLECETHKGTVQTCYGYICDACGEYFGEVPGHDIIIDEAVPPTCTQTGLTEGQHCSRCDDMTIIQEKVPATNHKDTLVKVDAKAATCTEAGWEAYEYCTACDYTTYEEIPALKHSFTKYEVTEEAECGKAGKEVAYCDHGCQTTDEREIPALKHSFTKYEVAEEAECGKTGKEVAYCDHGCGATDENEIPALKHEPLAAVVENEVAAECEKAGSYDLVVYCNLCGEELDRDTTTVAATGHADNDGDYKCDYGCGHEFEKPVDPTPDTPNTPDEPTDDTCDHICHSNNALMKFLWKIISFFYRLFNIQQYCDCGVIHYDTPVFG